MARGVFGRSEAEIDLLVRGMRSGIAFVGSGYIGAGVADRGSPGRVPTEDRQSSARSARAFPA